MHHYKLEPCIRVHIHASGVAFMPWDLCTMPPDLCTHLEIHVASLGSMYMHIVISIYIGCIGIHDSALDNYIDSTLSSCATWTIHGGHTCSFGPFLEFFEVVKEHVLRGTNFRGSYLLIEFP
jgi:hypothetical protein